MRNLSLILGGLALIAGHRRWAASFHASSLEPAEVDNGAAISIGRRVVVQSVLDAPPDAVWSLVKRPATFGEVVRPLLSFTTRNGRPLPDEWRVGETISLNLFGLGFLPLGKHNITIVWFDEARREAQTRERGALTPVWNHAIRVQPFGDGRALYTDQVDLDAGPLNPLVGPFALFLFRYRQTRWKSISRRDFPELAMDLDGRDG